MIDGDAAVQERAAAPSGTTADPVREAAPGAGRS